MRATQRRLAGVAVALLAATSCSGSPGPGPAPAPGSPSASASAARTVSPQESGRVVTTAYTTGYGYWDNTPPGSTVISNPVLHQSAGGTGTWADPVTIAVGHSISNGVDTLDFPAGTRMYIPNLEKYFIVEDACGDGATPQDIPCHNLSRAARRGATVWFDVWIGGSSSSNSDSRQCQSTLTGIHTVILDPSIRDYRVTPGDVLSGRACHANFGEIPAQQ
jgi:3D (Asp-Asp-Asp) domain-containing protein